MKKIMLLFVCGFIVLVFTGCSGKQVKCTMDDESAKASLIGTFKDDNLVKYEMEMTAIFEDEQEAEDEYNMVQYSASMMNSIDGVEGKAIKKGSNVTLRITANLTKMSSESINDMLDTDSMTVEQFKEYASDEGYICK